MPYPNEHSCRVKEPGDFEPDSFRRIKANGDKPMYTIIGKLKGETKTTEQAYRYPKADWSVAEARAHCKSHEGKFEPAAEKAEIDSAVQRNARRVKKIIMTAPDTYVQHVETRGENGEIRYREIERAHSTEDLRAVYEGTKLRLRQPDGSTYPVPILVEHKVDLPQGAIEDVELKDLGEGRLALEAIMVIEDDELADRLVAGRLWTSPSTITGGALGVGGRKGAYIEEVSLVSLPALRDYPARASFSAKQYGLAPELVQGEGGDFTMSDVEKMTARLEELTVSKEQLTAKLAEADAEKARLSARIGVLEGELADIRVERLSKELEAKGLVKGEVEDVIAQIKKRPDEQEAIVAFAVKMAARITASDAPGASPVGAPPEPDKAKKLEAARSIVVDYVEKHKK